MPVDAEAKNLFLVLSIEGWALKRIADELGIPYNVAVNWNIENAKFIYLGRAVIAEGMQDKYLMTWYKRIQLYGERLLAIKEELDKRDLSDVPTPKLFEMMIKCETMLGKEVTTFSTDADEILREHRERVKREEENMRKFYDEVRRAGARLKEM